MSFANSVSERMRVTKAHVSNGQGQQRRLLPEGDHVNSPVGSLPDGARPVSTLPVSFRSMYQLSCAPSPFLRVKAKMAPPFLMASLRSASSDRAEAIKSKAADEGQASFQNNVSNIHRACQSIEVRTFLKRHLWCCSAGLLATVMVTSCVSRQRFG